MTKQKRKENKINLFFLLLILNLYLISNLLANENICKKFDIKCKTHNYINETKKFQKKEFEESKKQLNKTKNKILKVLPKKN